MLEIIRYFFGERGAEIVNLAPMTHERGDVRITNGRKNGVYGDSDGFYSDSVDYSYEPQECFTKCEYCGVYSPESETTCTKCGAPLWK